jgi:hypothetical protein
MGAPPSVVVTPSLRSEERELGGGPIPSPANPPASATADGSIPHRLPTPPKPTIARDGRERLLRSPAEGDRFEMVHKRLLLCSDAREPVLRGAMALADAVEEIRARIAEPTRDYGLTEAILTEMPEEEAEPAVCGLEERDPS